MDALFSLLLLCGNKPDQNVGSEFDLQSKHCCCLSQILLRMDLPIPQLLSASCLQPTAVPSPEYCPWLMGTVQHRTIGETVLLFHFAGSLNDLLPTVRKRLVPCFQMGQLSGTISTPGLSGIWDWGHTLPAPPPVLNFPLTYFIFPLNFYRCHPKPLQYITCTKMHFWNSACSEPDLRQSGIFTEKKKKKSVSA